MKKVLLIVLFILLGTAIIFIYRNDILKIFTKNNIKIEINNIDNDFSLENHLKNDANIKQMTGIFKPNYEFINNIKIPNDLNTKSLTAIYVKSDTGKYDKLNNYNYHYHNYNGERHIEISFSNEYKPLRDYYFGDASKKSTINNTELEIFYYEDFTLKRAMYLVMFEYKNTNFDIETTNITEKELVELLKSIIK